MYEVLFDVSFIISIILLVFLYKVRNVNIAKLLIKCTILVAFWILMEILSYCIRINEIAILFQKAKFISIIFASPLYLLIVREYAAKNKKSIYYTLLIFIVPILSLLSLISNKIPYKFMSNVSIYYAKDIPIFLFSPDVGFYIHIIYSYSSILIGCYILMMVAIKSPKLYRRQSTFIFIGTLISISMNFLFISPKSKSIFIDATSICVLLTLIILYWGSFYMPKSIVVPIARDLLVENIKDFIIVVDSSNKIIDINPAAIKFIKFLRHENKKINTEQKINFIGIKIHEILNFLPDIKYSAATKDSRNESMVSFNFNGKTFYFTMYKSPILDTNKSQIGRLFMFHDVTKIQEYTNNLKQLNEELSISDRIISTAMEGILITDSSGNIIKVNNSFERISGYKGEELIGKNPRVLKSGHHNKSFYLNMWNDLLTYGYWEGEIWNRKKNGELYPKWMSITCLKKQGGIIENYIAISTDITKIKKTEDKLQSLAYYDLLTGIPNRTLFYERLENALIRANNNKGSVALLFMDLDGFKVINDSLGHAAGDLLLKEVAARIESSISRSDTVSRLGGDEFTVILENVNNHEDAKAAAESIIGKILLPYSILGREITLGVSIGIALSPYDESTVEGLVRKADAAMYDAKESGKGKYSFSSDEIERRNHEILEMQIKLNKALDNNEFNLYLQPQIIFAENEFKIIGAEALIRWKTIDGKIFTPDKFIPVSETNRMIIPIGNWILEEIFRIDKVLKDNGINIKLSINISSKQFENGNLVSKIKELFKENDSQNIDLVIEITESFLLQDTESAIQSLLEIKKLGIEISIDDFGTGFSSLSYLARLPVDYLKIDKSFIDDILSTNHKNLTSNIISMAKTLNLKTVAEGVETEEQANRLMDEGCDELQGYYFSKPLIIDDFIKYVKQFNYN
ncbi:diguanylate cyclase/phosphodiesterase with PAS/PAC sensor(s) [Clostridium carboxidivorans P7]|uniref:Diguanylate cyclase/phosphodiesterase with PAS/PAC sensor(S) n=1 Tax=Clostridium carboxidivorans P7 TaxID=536227 RepID=C6PSS6_9CLOT|nr:EAL domain-containing protein [Clostridium carboxidivorans]EET87665.1 diguanylate cyclase/phosphodiesterase with PAS/PAC sensor(s) [Clostridium carboxidivorans P7]